MAGVSVCERERDTWKWKPLNKKDSQWICRNNMASSPYILSHHLLLWVFESIKFALDQCCQQKYGTNHTVTHTCHLKFSSSHIKKCEKREVKSMLIIYFTSPNISKTLLTFSDIINIQWYYHFYRYSI